MSEQTILLCFAFGIPFVLAAAVIAAVGFILRRVRPDLYMTDEEKERARQKEWEQAAPLDGSNNDNNKEQI